MDARADLRTGDEFLARRRELRISADRVEDRHNGFLGAQLSEPADGGLADVAAIGGDSIEIPRLENRPPRRNERNRKHHHRRHTDEDNNPLSAKH